MVQKSPKLLLLDELKKDEGNQSAVQNEEILVLSILNDISEIEDISKSKKTLLTVHLFFTCLFFVLIILIT